METEQHTLVTEEIREEIQKFLEFNENENNLPESLGYSKCLPKRKVYCCEPLHKKQKQKKPTALK
jgi:hypothetical protein